VAHAWSGPDPTQSTDGGTYELGVEYVANSPVTVSAVRVWAGSTPGAVTGRRGRIWSTSGSLLGSASVATNLPSGWSEYTLDAPLDLTAGEHIVVSWTTGGFYGELNHGLDAAVVSADGLMTAVAGPSGVNGNGCFTTSTTAFPDRAAGQNTFYGIDVVYLPTGGDTPPSIVGMSAIADGATVTSQINATDAETLVGATYGWDWGDGTVASQAGNVASHTYDSPGLYAIVGTVTDAGGLSATAGRAVDIELPDPDVVELDFAVLIGALANHAARLGVFSSIVNHEPVSSPGNGVTAAIWCGPTYPARGASGLNSTSVVVVGFIRLYRPMGTVDQDALELGILKAKTALWKAYSGDFTLGGLVRHIDLLGQYGMAFRDDPAYQTWDSTQYRVVTLTVPMVVNDVVAQIP
jgi:Domain of unknown function (DUF4082)/PKD domain